MRADCLSFPFQKAVCLDTHYRGSNEALHCRHVGHGARSSAGLSVGKDDANVDEGEREPVCQYSYEDGGEDDGLVTIVRFEFCG